MQERRGDSEVRERVTRLEVKVDNSAIQIGQIAASADLANTKLDGIALTLAEARGAGKMAKVGLGLIATAAGFVGSLLNHVVIH